MTYLKRFFTSLLAVVLVFGLAPFPLASTNAYADEGTSSDTSSDTSSSSSETAVAGKYRITVTPQGENAYDYVYLCFKIYDASGALLYTSGYLDSVVDSDSSDDDYNSGITEAKWKSKSVEVTLDTAPSTIEFSCSYKDASYDGTEWTPTYEEISGQIPFKRFCYKTPVTGTLSYNPPLLKTNVDFCLCTIEPLDESGSLSGPLNYVDASGYSYQKAEGEYQNFTGDLNPEDTGEKWYAISGYNNAQALLVRGNVNLVLCDDAVLYASEGLWVAPNSTLTIYCQSGGTGQLIAETTTIQGSSFELAPERIKGRGSAAIGGYGDVIINGGNIIATGGDGAAGIGGDQGNTESGDDYVTCGDITINGGTITAEGGGGAAGIGAGYCAHCGDITINGGTINAVAGGGAGIGTGDMNTKYGSTKSSCGTITINGGNITAEGSTSGAGIGAGYGADIPDITITGGAIKATVRKAKEGYLSGGAGIGGGDFTGERSKGAITIGNDNGKPITIIAIATGQGAGIGGGTGGDGETNGGASSGPITISGSNTKVSAFSVYGAGIGTGGSNIGINSASGVADQQITINDGLVYAVSSLGGAGIGGGNKCDGGNITINGGIVSAIGGAHYASTEDYLGETYAVVSSREIMDTLGYYEELLNDMVAEMVIGWIFDEELCGAGIGGGAGGSTGTITINGGTVEAQCGNKLDRAIGAGLDGSNSTSGISIYDKAKVTYGYLTTESEEDSSTITTQSEDESTEKINVTISGVVRASADEAKKVNVANTNGYALIQEDVKDEGSGKVTLDDWTYGDKAETPVATSTTNGTDGVTYLYKAVDASDDAWSSDVPTNAGNYIVKATFPETDTYASCTATDEFTIAKRAVTLTTKDATKIYGESDPAFTATLTGLVEGDTLNYTLSRESGESVGAYTISATLGQNPNYSVNVNDTGKLTITQRSATLTIDNASKAYGDKDPAFTVTTTNVVAGDALKYTLSRDSGEDVGTYAISATLGENPNYDVTVKTGKLTIGMAAGSGTVTLDDWTYGDTAKTPVVTSETNGTDGVTYSYKKKGADDTVWSSEMPTDVGNYVVRATFPETDSYASCTATDEFAITQRSATLTIDNVSKAYFEKDPVFTATETNVVEGDTLNYTLRRASGESVGSYDITAALGDNPNYEVTVIPGKLTIGMAAGSGTVKLDDWTYGDTAKTPVVTSETNKTDGVIYSYKKKDADDTVWSSEMPTDVGNYVVRATFPETDSYASCTATDEFKITQREVTLTTDGVTKTYGQEDPTLTATETNVVEGDTLNYTLSRKSGEDVGTYAISAALGENPNYDVTVANTGKLTITQRPVTLTIDNATKTYGESDPDFTATETNVVAGDTLNYTLSRESGEDAGTYAINATLGENPNYDVTVNTGKLTINKAPGTGTVTIEGWTYGDTPNNPVPASETNGTDNVTYLYKATNASDDAWSSTVPTEVGSYVVKATFPETTNYEECTATAEFSIEAAPTTTNDSSKDSNGNTAKTGDEAPLVPLTVTASLAAALAAGAAVARRRSNEE